MEFYLQKSTNILTFGVHLIPDVLEFPQPTFKGLCNPLNDHLPPVAPHGGIEQKYSVEPRLIVRRHFSGSLLVVLAVAVHPKIFDNDIIFLEPEIRVDQPGFIPVHYRQRILVTE